MSEQREKKNRCGVWQILWLLVVFSGVANLGTARVEAVPIQVTYADGASEGFNDPTLGALRRRAFEAAASVWSQRLAGTVPIRVQVKFDPLGGSPTSATLGQAGPAGFFAGGNGFNAPLSDTFYVKGLANQFAGGDLDPTSPDILAIFNSDVDNQVVLGNSDFYYGLDGNPPTDANGIAKDSDFFAVVLHELGHGLGFTGLYTGSGFSSGAISSFDRNIAQGAGANGTLFTSLSGSERNAAARGGNLFFIGPRTRALSSAGAKLYAPASFSSGSSIYHLDEDTYSGAEELMTPFSTGNPHAPGPLNFAVFLDVGWGQVGGNPNPIPTNTPAPTPTPLPGPPNDDFVNAQPIAGAMGSIAGTSVRATRESGEPLHDNQQGGASIWYRWTAPANGSVVFSTQSSNFDTVMAAYTGSRFNQLTRVTSNDDQDSNILTSRIEFDAVSGQTYLIAIDGYGDSSTPVKTGSVALRWQQRITPAPPPPAPKPANDEFASAQVLAGPTGSAYGATLGATLQSGEPLHGSDAGGRSIWYQWTAPSNGQVTFEITGDGFVPQMSIYNGNTLNALNRVATASDTGRVSRVTFLITQGVVYRIAIDGRAGGSGRTLLRWLVKAAPPNDDFENARVLATNSGTIVGDNTLARAQTDEPQHAPDSVGNSIWYRWTAPADGIFAVLAQANFTPAVASYSGSSIVALTPIVPVLSTDNISSSRRDWSVRAGQTYQITIVGRTTRNPTGGPVLVRWRFTPGLTPAVPNPPANDGKVTPSSASAQAETTTLQVAFSSASDAARFADALIDPLKSNAVVNGVAVMIQDALVQNSMVTVLLSTSNFQAGDVVKIESTILRQPLTITAN